MDSKTKISPIAAKVQAVLQALPENKYSFKNAPVITVEGVEHTVLYVRLSPQDKMMVFGFAADDPCGYSSISVDPETLDWATGNYRKESEELEDHLDFLKSLCGALNQVLDERNRDRTDSICNIAVRIADLLWKDGGKGDIAFDPRSYDNPDDIPHIVVAGKRHDVLSLNISKDGSQVTVTTCDWDTNTYWDYSFYADFAYDTDREFADNVDDYEAVLEKMGVRELFSDAYYETGDSQEIGDFETDFLNIR